MKIQSAEFVSSAFERAHWINDTLPEIAFLGRSNVGKSSLINSLLLRKGLARTSNTPGRTQSINFFRINDAFVLVDLPGYGYARVAKERRAEWRPLIEGYLRTSPNLRGLVLLLDSRREPSDDDRAMLDFLAERETPVLVAITKMDKHGSDAGRARVEAIARALELDPDQVVPVSARTGLGREELASALMELVGNPA